MLDAAGLLENSDYSLNDQFEPKTAHVSILSAVLPGKVKAGFTFALLIRGFLAFILILLNLNLISRF
jgi:hypothetical protein